MSKNVIRTGSRRTAYLIGHQKFIISDGVTGIAKLTREESWNLVDVMIMIFWMFNISLTWSFARAYIMSFQENIFSNHKEIVINKITIYGS